MAAIPIESKMDNQTFRLFPNFPTEIRLKIWTTYTTFQPRIVEVCLIKDDVERPTYDHRNIINPFYSPTPLPKSLFNINRESRSVALQAYILSFPNGPHPPETRWNPAIDMVFLPAWCFHYHVRDFMAATRAEEKGLIQRLAFETLVRNGYNEEGMINFYIQIDEFRNLREVVLVQRLPDFTGCGCCHEFDGPEKGLVGFREVGEENKEDGELEEGEIDENKVAEEEAEVDEEAVEARKRMTMSDDAMEVFLAIREQDPGYSIPSVREVDLMRDGVLI
jgi:2EXR family